MQDYKPNSNRFKEEQRTAQKAIPEKKVEKVIKGKAKTKKKSDARRLMDSFISEDVSSVKSYIVDDLIIPTVKRTIVDAIKNSAEMIFLGKVSDSGRGRSGGGYVSYRDYGRRDERKSSDTRSSFDYDEIRFEYRGDAEAVLDQMIDMIDRYGIATVADMYDMADMTAPYTSNRYGWTSLRTADVARVSDGYIIRLPKAMPID